MTCYGHLCAWCSLSSEFKRESKRGLCRVTQLGTELFWNRRLWEHCEGYVVSRVKVGAFQTCLHVVSRLKVFEVFMGLSMTMARVTFLKAFRTWSCWQIWGGHHEERLMLFWLDLYVHVFYALVLVFWFWNLIMYMCTIELSWQMMRTWEETQTESESN